jgi:hypothetical protein
MIPVNYDRIMLDQKLRYEELDRLVTRKNKLPMSIPSLNDDDTGFYQEESEKIDKEIKFVQDYIDDVAKELNKISFSFSASMENKKDSFIPTNDSFGGGSK